MRVVVDAAGRLVGVAYTGTSPGPGERIITVTPGDYRRLQTGLWHWESIDAVLDGNRAWRVSPRAQQVLDQTTGPLSENLNRNIAQDLIRETQSHARQLNTLWRAARDGISPELVEDT